MVNRKRNQKKRYKVIRASWFTCSAYQNGSMKKVMTCAIELSLFSSRIAAGGDASQSLATGVLGSRKVGTCAQRAQSRQTGVRSVRVQRPQSRQAGVRSVRVQRAYVTASRCAFNGHDTHLSQSDLSGVYSFGTGPPLMSTDAAAEFTICDRSTGFGAPMLKHADGVINARRERRTFMVVGYTRWRCRARVP